MAGFGEAAAILAVAQSGASLAFKLADFIRDYRTAPEVIESLRYELETTSSTLKDLGELAAQNGLRNKKGVTDTENLTKRCNRAICDIKIALKMEDIPPDSAPGNQETDLTRLDRMKLALSKGKVDVSRADLARLKFDMMLLYASLMTFEA